MVVVVVGIEEEMEEKEVLVLVVEMEEEGNGDNGFLGEEGEKEGGESGGKELLDLDKMEKEMGGEWWRTWWRNGGGNGGVVAGQGEFGLLFSFAGKMEKEGKYERERKKERWGIYI